MGGRISPQRVSSLKEKIRVVYPGANLPKVPTRSDIERASAEKTNRECQLLLIGYDPYRKGLDTAIHVTDRLCSKGLPAVLHVIGMHEPPRVRRHNVHFHGPLDKSNEQQWAILNKLYLNSFVFILPSRAECLGLVLCEAAAFGLPAIVPQVGGMPEIVADGHTGCVVDARATPEEYANAMLGLWKDAAVYRRLSHNARTKYEKVLNWERCIQSLTALMYGELLEEGKP